MSEQKFEDTVILGGEKVTVYKLRAGAYNEAQKVFLKIIKAAVGQQNQDDTLQNIIQEVQGEPEVKPSSILNELELMEMLQDMQREFVGICSKKGKEWVDETAYPDEVSDAFVKCYQLNSVMENLKKSGPRMQTLVGGETKVPEVQVEESNSSTGQ